MQAFFHFFKNIGAGWAKIFCVGWVKISFALAKEIVPTNTHMVGTFASLTMFALIPSGALMRFSLRILYWTKAQPALDKKKLRKKLAPRRPND